MSKIVRIALISQILLTLFSIGSLFLPYLIRSDIQSLDPSIEVEEEGFNFLLTWMILFFMVATVILSFTRKAIPAFANSCLILMGIYVLRKNIHFQGFIDHDFDTSTGLGFYILTVNSVLFFKSSLILLFLRQKNKLPNSGNSELLDQDN